MQIIFYSINYVIFVSGGQRGNYQSGANDRTLRRHEQTQEQENSK